MNVIPEIFLILWEDEAMSVTEKFFSVLLILSYGEAGIQWT